MADRKKVLLIGAGGHAGSILESSSEGFFHGYAAPEPTALPLAYCGNDAAVLANCPPAHHAIHIGIGFNGRCSLTLRRKIIELYGAYEAATVIAESAIVTPNSQIGPGCSILSRAVVNRATIGNHSVVNTGAIIEHDCRIGSNVFIGPGAVICGEVDIADDTFVGAGASVRNGITICAGTTIGIGAVVTKNITEPGIYVGNPARLINNSNNA